MPDKATHNFHIPVMGICYTIDTPLKVARYGITSVVSIIEDNLLEDLRAFYCKNSGLEYTPIPKSAPDCRAERVTAYLNLINDLLQKQMVAMRAGGLYSNHELLKYIQLLPVDSNLREEFQSLLAMGESLTPQAEEAFWSKIQAGAIDVNIMSKVDREYYDKEGGRMATEFTHALTALRGYANSNLSSSVVFSAGYNPNLYNYIENFPDFFPTAGAEPRKKIILKVSDYRSALVQGKILAKKGIWVSEFRIESGLNCGGHAFPTEGLLMGPILHEFAINREALKQELYIMCQQALADKGKTTYSGIPTQKLTAQGGIGTAAEHNDLIKLYNVDSIGWGSPFLMVPEATNVDDETLQKLISAKQEDYFISNASPLGIPFNNFKTSSSEKQRKERIAKKRTGSPCPKEYLAFNTEFTKQPICTASRQYYVLKEKELRASTLDEQTIEETLHRLGEKDCLCEGLTNAVRLKNNLPLVQKLTAVSICPGPNLAWFKGTFSLQEMVDHIYGRTSIINHENRPHMFLNEFKLYIDYLERLVNEFLKAGGNDKQQRRYIQKYVSNLHAGAAYYRQLANESNLEGWDADGLEKLSARVNEVADAAIAVPA